MRIEAGRKKLEREYMPLRKVSANNKQALICKCESDLVGVMQKEVEASHVDSDQTNALSDCFRKY